METIFKALNNYVKITGNQTCEKLDNLTIAQQQLKVGISLNVREKMTPLNGFRHPPTNDTTGWYIWVGEELSDDPDFFNHYM